jgi:hypothetical protein
MPFTRRTKPLAWFRLEFKLQILALWTVDFPHSHGSCNCSKYGKRHQTTNANIAPLPQPGLKTQGASITIVPYDSRMFLSCGFEYFNQYFNVQFEVILTLPVTVSGTVRVRITIATVTSHCDYASMLLLQLYHNSGMRSQIAPIMAGMKACMAGYGILVSE